MKQTIITQVKERKEVAAIQVILASFFIALMAQIRVPIFFSPVPITGQTFAIILVGGVLGSRRGSCAAALYLLQGAMGYPVFAGGAAGWIHLLGPTGGYLLFYPLEAYLIGKCFEHRKKFLLYLIPILQLGVGSFWLALFVGGDQAFYQGFYPFVLLEIAKVILVNLLTRKVIS
ncbi:MAG: biotin transporter BioY [Chlamydiia bacterium]|nr:biotin transporter BioY [Chlamydiia bacterium]